MPPRRRRDGAEGVYQLDPVLEAELDNEAARLHAIEDPVRAVQAVTEFFDAVELVLARVAEPRHRAIIELYEDLGSYRRSRTRPG